jgi:hypothetical protein
MWADYGVFGEQELWNNLRFYKYITDGYGDSSLTIKAPKCDRLPALYGDDGIYTNPVTDMAPWYNPDIEESGEFAGIYVQSVAGFDNLGFRDLVTTPFGTSASRRNLDPKTLTVTAILTGNTCCSVQYGYRWLLARLLERNCEDGKEVSFLSMYDCCPTADEAFGLDDQELIDKYLRTMYNVRVAKDPTIVDRLGNCCGDGCTSTTLVVQWTFALENQKLYRNIELCADSLVWPTDVHSANYDCVVCEEDPTVELEVVRDKRRFAVQVLANKTWCPVGDWEPWEYFDNPDEGYLEIVNTDIAPNPFNIYLKYDGTFRGYNYAIPWPDLRTVDLCKINFQITQYEVYPTALGFPGLEDFNNDVELEKMVLPIRLNPTDAYSGTWESQGWSYNKDDPFPPPGTKIVIDNGCECVSHSDDDCEIVLNENLTWMALFEDIGTFPPLGCNKVSIFGQSPGTYIVRETVPLENAFSGLPVKTVAVTDSYEGVSASYSAPGEWLQKCCKIEFMSGVERAEPYISYFSGSEELYNFRADFYALRSGSDPCLCDELTPEQEADWACRTPDFSIKAGRSIPADSQLIYDPRTRQIKGINNDMVFDATGIVSGKNGGSPYFFEFPQCFGVCVVFTAEIRRNVSNVIVSPAADATITAGHIPFTYVGV